MLAPTFTEFVARAAILALVLSAMALIDWRIHRERSTRWREYTFLALCGLAGAVFGVCVDAFTASASPEYFWYGKGVPNDDQYWPSVAQIGFQAGFVAGAVIGGLLLVTNSVNRQIASLPILRLCCHIPWIAVAAVATGTISGLFLPKLNPLGLREQMSGLLTQDELMRFMTVWSVHAGLYCGGCIGTLGSCARVWRARRYVVLRELRVLVG